LIYEMGWQWGKWSTKERSKIVDEWIELFDIDCLYV